MLFLTFTTDVFGRIALQNIEIRSNHKLILQKIKN